MAASRTTAAAMAAVQTRVSLSKVPSVRATATQARPHAVASAGAMRPPSSIAASTATAAATTMPTIPTGISSKEVKPSAEKVAYVLAKVATSTQPKYRPKVPSVRIISTMPPVRGRPRMYMMRISTASSRRMTTTDSHSSSSWTVNSQPALSRADSSAHGRSTRWRSEARAVGVNCQIA